MRQSRCTRSRVRSPYLKSEQFVGKATVNRSRYVDAASKGFFKERFGEEVRETEIHGASTIVGAVPGVNSRLCRINSSP